MPETNETFETTASEVFEVNAETRTIRGLVVPFGVTGDNGRKFQFSADTQFTWPSDVSRVKLLMGHDYSAPVGYATTLEKTEQGISGTFKVARGAEGDRALSLAEDHVYDGLSMGLGRDAKFVSKGDVNHGTVAPISEVSLTPLPAFADSRITSVAASAVPDNASRKGQDMPENDTKVVESEATALDFSAVTNAITEGFAKANLNVAPREQVAAGSGAQVTAEAPVYRFDGGQGEHEFSTDLFAVIRERSGEARERLDKFMTNFAATDSGDVGVLAPSTYRPDLYVDQAVAATPVYDALNRGSITNNTPFVAPKFGSATGLVSDHTEGDEPDDGTFTATSQTVTPSAVSGQATITREVVDAGGSPQVSGLIWAQMLRAYDASLEAKSAAVLTGSSAAELGTVITAGDVDGDLADGLEANLALLVFLDGGEFFTGFVGHQSLYTRLASAKDEMGRRLFPQIAPSNANGSTGPKYRSLNVGGYDITPAKSLGAAGTGKSYVFDPAGVGVWASSAQRIALPETVATTANVGIFGYIAGAVLDVNRVRKITYNPTIVEG